MDQRRTARRCIIQRSISAQLASSFSRRRDQTRRDGYRACLGETSMPIRWIASLQHVGAAMTAVGRFDVMQPRSSSTSGRDDVAIFFPDRQVEAIGLRVSALLELLVHHLPPSRS